ncbi:Ribonuclease [Posidoniimonas polymericola]|uniref:Ribonuclease n=1 Tax=Posidoniimonas polymericola TaxID=2528002 RepID=A0A5C5YD98_9BACT|nr:MBL fold metallo-hydrolase [Posidoniimonas polymericola]TWT73697.1 Ribonuclease [Posidoniimonas polymericola]
MFHYENGLMLTRPRLAIDIPRRQPRAFVSHAHADHIARHELALCTPATAALYRHRLGASRRVIEMPYGEPLDYQGAKLTALPAGHCLGSAMLLAVVDGQRLLYTGDFKLGESLTAQRAQPPEADLLVMETTFGNPKRRMPPRAEVIGEFIALVRRILADGKTPVVHAYQLGKSQEVTAMLTSHGLPVLQHPSIYEVSRVYERCGVALGREGAEVGAYHGSALAGHVVVTLPRTMPAFRLAGMGDVETITLTGWAIDPGARFRLKVDHALPLSDHADFDELVELVRLVRPRRVATTHGPPGFDEQLRALGYDAQPLAPDAQRRLFE